MSVSSEDTLRETARASGRVQTYPPPKTVPEYSDSPSYPSSPERFSRAEFSQVFIAIVLFLVMWQIYKTISWVLARGPRPLRVALRESQWTPTRLLEEELLAITQGQHWLQTHREQES
ncbi:hypothetical protein EVAR_87972_1 [Eumeta japonica]|uniref:Uncharacterized protein n=1 Tax=Eumeta variegata TaxID=151549 RepID=A0A4C1VCN7_EUMVA|nr:hypothetical protein EVAR_87972_1 [Eumeta japonica]